MAEGVSNNDKVWESPGFPTSNIHEPKCGFAVPQGISPCPAVDQFYDSGWHGVSGVGVLILILTLVDLLQNRRRNDKFFGLKGILKFGKKKPSEIINVIDTDEYLGLGYSKEEIDKATIRYLNG